MSSAENQALVQVSDYTHLKEDDSPQKVIVELMKLYYREGWVSGTGGGISIQQDGKVYIAPSGIHKERIQQQDIYILDAKDHQKVYYDPNTIYKTPKFKVSACQPLFYLAFTMRGAGAVLHSHALSTVMATLVFEGQSEFKITHIEMIKGIKGNGYHDTLVVPIIENTAYENELEDSMREAIEKYPNTYAVLVRRHGVYIWGKDWIEAKTHAECYHYLFETAVRMKQIGLDPAKPSN